MGKPQNELLKFNTSEGYIYIKQEYKDYFFGLVDLLEWGIFKHIDIKPVNKKDKCEGLAYSTGFSDEHTLNYLRLPKFITYPKNLFIMAHEFAHVLLGHISFTNNQSDADEDEKMEIEANRFAFDLFKKWGIKVPSSVLNTFYCIDEAEEEIDFLKRNPDAYSSYRDKLLKTRCSSLNQIISLKKGIWELKNSGKKGSIAIPEPAGVLADHVLFVK